MQNSSVENEKNEILKVPIIPDNDTFLCETTSVLKINIILKDNQQTIIKKVKSIIITRVFGNWSLCCVDPGLEAELILFEMCVSFADSLFSLVQWSLLSLEH